MPFIPYTLIRTADLKGISCSVDAIEGEEINSFISGKFPFGSYALPTGKLLYLPSVFFIDLHGYAPKNGDKPEYFLKSTQKITAASLISSIIKTTYNKKQINVIHLLSCFSENAHHCLDDLPGNIILCTYSEPNQVFFSKDILYSIEEKIDATNLIKYTLDNLHLCAAVGFKISCKIDEKIFQHKINSDGIKLSKNLEELLCFLQKKYESLKIFFDTLQKKFVKNYPEIFSEPLFHGAKIFNEEELSRAVNISLSLETSRKNIDINKINNLLKIGVSLNSSALTAPIRAKNYVIVEYLLKHNVPVSTLHISEAIREKELKVLQMLLQHPSAEVDTLRISEAIREKELKVLQMLLQHPSAEVDTLRISEAIREKELKVLQMLLQHPSAEVDTLRISEAIREKELKVLQMLLQHPSAEVDTLHISEAIREKELKVLQMLLQHPSAEVDTLRISEAIREKELKVLQMLLQHPSAEVDTLHISEAIHEKELKVLEIVLQHPSAEVSTLHISEAIREKELKVLQMLLQHPSAEVSTWHINEAMPEQSLTVLFNLQKNPQFSQDNLYDAHSYIIEKNLEVFKTILNHPSTKIDITPDTALKNLIQEINTSPYVPFSVHKNTVNLNKNNIFWKAISNETIKTQLNRLMSIL